jgi:hypothetical protein
VAAVEAWRAVRGCGRPGGPPVRVNVLEAALRRVAGDLSRYRQDWALVGGFAVSARAEPRFTRDIDMAVAVAGDAESEALVRSLLSDGYTPRSPETIRRGRKTLRTFGRCGRRRQEPTSSSPERQYA